MSASPLPRLNRSCRLPSTKPRATKSKLLTTCSMPLHCNSRPLQNNKPLTPFGLMNSCRSILLPVTLPTNRTPVSQQHPYQLIPHSWELKNNELILCWKFGLPYLSKAGYSSHKSSDTHSYQRVQYFCVSKCWCSISVCPNVGAVFLCVQMLVQYFCVSKCWCSISVCPNVGAVFLCVQMLVQYFCVSKCWCSISVCPDAGAVFLCVQMLVQYFCVQMCVQYLCVSRCVCPDAGAVFLFIQMLVQYFCSSKCWCSIFVHPNAGAVFVRVQMLVWLPVVEIVSVCAHVDACNWTEPL